MSYMHTIGYEGTNYLIFTRSAILATNDLRIRIERSFLKHIDQLKSTNESASLKLSDGSVFLSEKIFS